MTTCQTHWWPGHHGHYGHHVSSVCPRPVWSWSIPTHDMTIIVIVTIIITDTARDNLNHGLDSEQDVTIETPPRDSMKHMELWWKHNNSSGSLPELVSSPSLCSTQLSIFCIIHKNFHQSPPSQISWAATASHYRKALDTSIQVLSDTTCFWWQFYILASNIPELYQE